MKKFVDAHNMSVTGVFQDVITNKRTGDVIKTEWNHNLVVESVTKLVAALICNHFDNNKVFWAVGSGEDVWDTDGAPVVLTSDCALTNEIGRKDVTNSIEYYNDSNNPTETVTNKLHITATFTEDDCNGDWREFGLFAGDATNTIGSGIMIDNKRHPHIGKTDEMIIERHLILTFNLGTSTAEDGQPEVTDPTE